MFNTDAEIRYRKLDFTQAKQILDSTPGAMLVDVREEVEYITGHAANAVLLPLDEISETTAAEVIPARDTPLILYCRTGKRSAAAAQKLLRLGYTTVYDVGGLSGWPYGME